MSCWPRRCDVLWRSLVCCVSRGSCSLRGVSDRLVGIWGYFFLLVVVPCPVFCVICFFFQDRTLRFGCPFRARNPSDRFRVFNYVHFRLGLLLFEWSVSNVPFGASWRIFDFGPPFSASCRIFVFWTSFWCPIPDVLSQAQSDRKAFVIQRCSGAFCPRNCTIRNDLPVNAKDKNTRTSDLWTLQHIKGHDAYCCHYLLTDHFVRLFILCAG